jgi:hypothetical protein
MDPVTERWSVQYGERRLGDTGRYAVVKGQERKQFDSKTEAIAEAQRLNGWQVDGNERNYASQAAQAASQKGGCQ